MLFCSEKIFSHTEQIQNSVSQFVNEWLVQLGVADNTAAWLKVVVMLLAIVILSLLLDWITKKVVITFLKRAARRTKTLWDDALLKRRVLHRIIHIIPALIVYIFIPIALQEFNPIYYLVIQALAKVFIVFIVVLALDAFLNATHDIYLTFEISKTKPIKGYIQVVKIIIYLIGSVLMLSILINKSPWYFIGGLGAFAAVLILVFKDTLLSLVASIQISANDMLRPGDWISMPDFGADGDVVEINLTNVKVRNWDKTISSIPTYALISNSFKNWRGMEESGGRRIMRSILIDINTIKFCDQSTLEEFKKIVLIKEYIENKQKEIEQFNKTNNISDELPVNGRRQTNIGVFQEYLRQYIRNNPNLNPEMTHMVRQLEPTEKGVPVQIYLFSKVKTWVDYEKIQADLFDHIFAVLPFFELKPFQNPSGRDIQAALSIIHKD